MIQDWGGYWKHGILWDTVADCVAAEKMTAQAIARAVSEQRQECHAHMAQAVAAERERMRIEMDSIDTCPCDVCIEREPTNIHRLHPRATSSPYLGDGFCAGTGCEHDSPPEVTPWCQCEMECVCGKRRKR